MFDRLTIDSDGSIALPQAIRDRYGLIPNALIRLIETEEGILLVPLTSAPMGEALAAELAQWQALGAESWERFPYET